MGKQEPYEVQQKCMQDLGWKNPMQQYRQGGDCLEGGCLDKDLRVSVGSKLDVKHQCALGVKKANCILECISQDCGRQVEGDDYSPLLSTGETYLRRYVQFWTPSARKTQTHWSRSSKGPPS